MARKSPSQLPARENAETSASVYGRALANRQRAVLADIFERVQENPKYRAAAEAQFIADPIGSAERLHKLYGELPGKESGANPLANIGNLYLQAVVAAQPAAPGVPPPALVVDAEPSGTSRVQHDVTDW